MTCLLLAAVVAAADAPDRAARLAKMELVTGTLPGDDRKVPADVRVVSEEKLDGYTRTKLTFAVEAGDRVPAWLLVPTGFRGQRPAVLCLHQTIPIGKDEPIGLGTEESKQQAVHLVRRGYVCLAPDYPSFGEYKYDFNTPKWASGVLKAVWNNMRAADVLAARPGVDADRLGVIGHSLGGHTALFTATFDVRFKVAVSSCGFNSFKKYYGGNLKGWASDRYMPRIASRYGSDPAKVPFDFDDVLAAIAPRAVFASAPLRDANFEVSGVRDVIGKVEPVYRALGAADKLMAIYPDSGHDWPEAARVEAYQFVDRWLRP